MKEFKLFAENAGIYEKIENLTSNNNLISSNTKKIISTNSLSEEKAKKVIPWVNKALVKWSKEDSDEINTIEGRKKKIKSLTKKGIKKFK